MVHAADEVSARRAIDTLRDAYALGNDAPNEVPPVLEVLR
jgi:hypothetical protein